MTKPDFGMNPGGMGHELLRRQMAAGATMNKFRKKKFEWKKGHTCVHLARFHLKKMGHAVPKMPPVASMLGAVRALEAKGWANTCDLLDAQPGLQRIPPARMLLGDLAVAPSEDGLGSILVNAGVGKLIGWHENAEGMVVIQIPLGDLLGAWRV